MKKLIFAASAALLIVSCGNSSVKGAWNKEDMDKANQEIKSVDADLKVLGDKKQAYIDCYLQKLENNYENFQAADSDEKGCEKLAVECASELFE